MITIRVSPDDFDTGHELAQLEILGGGAVASFTGIVRSGGTVVSMTLDHYPAMTERALDALAAAACQRWTLLGVTVIHRIGELPSGARIVLVACAAAHRGAALEACAFLIDRLKTDVPLWKKERHADGSDHWVGARATDETAAALWQR